MGYGGKGARLARPINLSGRPCVWQHPEGSMQLAALVEEGPASSDVGDPLGAVRAVVADLIGSHDDEVILTSGGAESNNAALKGLAAAALHHGRAGRIVLSAVEHPTVRHPARGLARLGFEVVEVPVDRCARVDEGRFIEALDGPVSLAALQWANDEIGALQPVISIARHAAHRGIPLHVDATAAAGWVPIDWRAVPAATMSLAGDRMGAPPGVGALVVRRGAAWLPLIEGGIEEDGRRAGGLHPALVTALGLSVEAARSLLDGRAATARRRRDHLARGCQERISGVTVQTPADRSLPGHLHLRVDGAEGEALLTDMACNGVLAASGSACVEGAGVPSAVLRACGFSPQEAMSCLLFRVSAHLTPAEVEMVVEVLARATRRLREMSP